MTQYNKGWMREDNSVKPQYPGPRAQVNPADEALTVHERCPLSATISCIHIRHMHAGTFITCNLC